MKALNLKKLILLLGDAWPLLLDYKFEMIQGLSSSP
jgi:hypothetical protein